MPKRKFKPASASVQQVAPNKTGCDLTSLKPVFLSLGVSLQVESPVSYTHQPHIRSYFSNIKLSAIQESQDKYQSLTSLVCFFLHPSLFFCKKEINQIAKQVVYLLGPLIETKKLSMSQILQSQIKIQDLKAQEMAYVLTRSIDLELILKEQEEEEDQKSHILRLPFSSLLSCFLKAVSSLDCTENTSPSLIKTLIESLHSILLLLSKLPQVSGLYPDELLNIYEYSLSVLQKEQVHKDVLTQIAILFWKTSAETLKIPNFQLLESILKGDTNTAKIKLTNEKRITLIKGYLLTYPLNSQILLNSSAFSILLETLKAHDKIVVLLSFQTVVTLLQALRSTKQTLSVQSRDLLLAEVLTTIMGGILSQVRGISHCAEDAMEMLCLLFEEGNSILERIVEYPFGSKNFFTGLYALLKSETISVKEIITARPHIIAEIYSILGDTRNASTRTVAQFIRLFMQLTRKQNSNEDWVSLWMSSEDVSEPDDVFLNKLLPLMIALDSSAALPFISKIYTSLSQDNITSFTELLCIARKENLLEFTPDGAHIQALNLLLPYETFLSLCMTHNEDEARISSLKLLVSQIKYTEVISDVEYKLAHKFLMLSVKSSDQKYRQQILKHFHSFLIRVRASCYSQENAQNQEIRQQGERFLCSVYKRCTVMIKECISFEVLYTHLEILKFLIQLFGETEVVIKFLSNDPFQPLRLTTKFHWFTTPLLCTLVRLQKNSWQKVRALSQFILTLFPESILEQNSMLDDYIKAAKGLMVSARCMVSEGAANMLLLLYRRKLSPKLLTLLNDNLAHQEEKIDNPSSQLQTGFLDIILKKIQRSLEQFEKSLVRGSNEHLIHGYLSLVRLIFEGEGIEIKEKSEVKTLFGKLIDTLLNVSAQLSKMLSNLGLETDSEESELKVDCRGHPVVDQEWNEDNQDFDNFVVVGIWLALKEAGEALQSIINWIELPVSDSPEQVLPTELIVRLAYTLKQQLFGLKHRGAIAKAEQSFAKLCSKLIISINPTLSKLPQELLLESLNEIKVTDVSKILRRSAGIPPLVLSILKAEPNNKTPRLLNLTLSFLFQEYENAKLNDFRVHTLNIMKAIFQDSSLRHDVNQFVARALRIDIQGFSSPHWGIRNSCLMSFTSIARRIFGSNRIQEASVFLQLQSVKKVKGMTTNQFFFKFAELQPFLLKTLQSGEESSKYLAMLLLSRLHPSARVKHSQQETISVNLANQFVKTLEASFESNDIFVRQVGARAILPFIPQNDCISYASGYLAKLTNSKLNANQTVAYLNLINLLILWGGSLVPQHLLSQLYQDVLTFFKATLSRCSSGVYPLYESIVTILTSVLKFLKTSPKLPSDLESSLISIVADGDALKNQSPGYASYKKAVLKFLNGKHFSLIETNPLYLVNLLSLMLTDNFEKTVNQKYEELEFLVQMVSKLVKHKKPQSINELADILLKHIPLASSKSSLLQSMLRLLQRIIKLYRLEVSVEHLGYLLNSKSPSIQKRVIKIFSLSVRGSIHNNTQFFKILSDFSYSDQQDEVRIACVKAWRNMAQRVSEPFTFDFLRSILFLLVDQNPAIRTLMAYYASSFLLKSLPQVLKLQNQDVLLDHLLDLLSDKFPKEISELIASDSIYEEHLAKNFGDKIFFYEPVNRYVDIAYLKQRIASKLVKESKAKEESPIGDWKKKFEKTD